jgi:hypothetical protein
VVWAMRIKHIAVRYLIKYGRVDTSSCAAKVSRVSFVGSSPTVSLQIFRNHSISDH